MALAVKQTEPNKCYKIDTKLQTWLQRKCCPKIGYFSQNIDAITDEPGNECYGVLQNCARILWNLSKYFSSEVPQHVCKDSMVMGIFPIKGVFQLALIYSPFQEALVKSGCFLVEIPKNRTWS